MKNTVLFGNGLNLISNPRLKWDDLLCKISTDKLINNIPNIFQYESIVLNHDFLATKTCDMSSFNITGESVVKRNIANMFKDLQTNELFLDLVSLDVDNYLTTNYDNLLLNKCLENNYKISSEDKSERLYSIRRNVTLQKENSIKKIWNIHGCIDAPNSIMLGLDHYCGDVGKINSYVKGSYKFGKDGKIVAPLKDRIKELYDSFNILSWIDLFFVSNVHIVGLGLYYDELDIWWLINRRKRYQEILGEDVIRNRIVYYANEIDEEMKLLLENFGVEVVTCPKYTGDYSRQYECFFNQISVFQ